MVNYPDVPAEHRDFLFIKEESAMSEFGETQQFSAVKEERTPKDIIMTVYNSMLEKGYDPVNQIVGYLLSGDPTYISSYNNSRYLISKIDRDELLDELVRYYINGNE